MSRLALRLPAPWLAGWSATRARLAPLEARLARLRAWWPLSGFGAGVLAVAFWALRHWGMQRIDLVLLVVGAVGVGLVVTSSALTLATAAWLRRRLQGGASASEGPRTGRTGIWAPTGLVLPRWDRIPFVYVTCEWVEPRARARFVETDDGWAEEAQPLRRTEADAVVRRFGVQDVFGLCHVRWTWRQSQRVTVLPSPGLLDRTRVLQGLAAGQDLSHPDGPPAGDPIDLRPYAPGDPVRMVLWKVYARTRRLVVRTPERAVSPAEKTLAWLVSDPADEASAGAARAAVEEGALGDEWTLGADGTARTASRVDEALPLLAGSGNTTVASPAHLRAFLQTPDAGRAGRAVVFLPPSPGPWLEPTIEVLRRAPQAVHCVIGFDGLDRQPGPAPWRQWWIRDGESDLPRARLQALRRVVDPLQQAGIPVTLVDRGAGRVWSGSALTGGSP